MPKSTQKTPASKGIKKTRARQCSRPELLPYPDFPLFPHGSDRWAKKIRGKLYYFGKVQDGWKPALDKYQREKDDLYAGRKPRAARDGLTVGALCNRFLEAKRHLVDTSELSPRSFVDYHATCKLLVEHFGAGRFVDDLAADDFEGLRRALAKTRGPVTLGNEIQRVRVVCKFAYDSMLVDKPVRYGPTFKRPNKTTLRRERQKKGPRMFEATELRRIIGAAGGPLRAMILLGVNAGLGNHDVGTLPLSAIDLKSGWLDYPRPKTAIHRRCWLWPETIEAIKAAIAGRPAPKEAAAEKLVFVTRYGKSWSKERDTLPDTDVLAKKKSTATDNPVSKEMIKLLKAEKLHRPGLAFYALRHTFETIGGETKDQPAVDAIMGHADNSMAGAYRERVGDDRLKAVAEHVRTWLLTADRGDEDQPKGGWTLA
jgi:integrase